MATDGRPLSFYGGIALSVAEIREGPSVRTAPISYHQAHIVDAQVIVDPSQLNLTALCTTRNAVVLRVPFSAVHDVRRIGSMNLVTPIGGNRASTSAWAAMAGGTNGTNPMFSTANNTAVGVEVEYLLQERSEAVIGSVWRTYVCTIISTRRDTTIIERLFRALLGLYRLTRALDEPEIDDAVVSPHTHRPQMPASTLSHEQVDFLQPLPPGVSWSPSRTRQHGGLDVALGAAPSPFRNHDVTNSDAMRELRAIQMRRQQRQQQLVGAMILGDSGEAPHPGGSSIGASGRGMGQAWNDQAPSDLHWCRWCGEFQTGVNHVRNCPNRAVECSWCGERMKKKQFDDSHRHQCSEIPGDDGAARYRVRAPTSNAAVGTSDAPLPPTDSQMIPRMAEPSVPVPQAAAAPEPKPEPKAYGRTCIWCDEDKPKSHDPNCPKRRTMCKSCNEVIMVCDKAKHRMSCIKAPSKTIRTMGREKAALAMSQSLSDTDLEDGSRPTTLQSQRSVRWK